MARRALIALAAVALLARGAGAQVATINGVMTGPILDDTPGAFKLMRADLRQLVKAQEGWKAEHHEYGSALRRTGKGGVHLDPSPGVKIELLYVTRESWVGRATHRAVKGKSCVIIVGAVPDSRMPKTRKDSALPTRAGEPTCDAE